MVLLKNLGDLTRTYGAATLTDSEAKTCVASNRVDELNVDLNVVTGHYHLYTFGESDLTGYVKCTDVELGTILVVERSVTATFLFLEDINRSFELAVGLNNTRMADYHTALDVFLVDTAEKETYVVTGFALIKKLAEHLNAGYNRLHVCTKTHDLNFVAYLYDTSLDTTGSNCTTTGD